MISSQNIQIISGKIMKINRIIEVEVNGRQKGTFHPLTLKACACDGDEAAHEPDHVDVFSTFIMISK